MDELPAKFTHLKVHSYYTLLGATASVEMLVNQAVSHGFQALALTDTNVLYGAVVFARACRAANIKPIIGMTVNMAALPDAPVLEKAVSEGSPQITLLAKNPTGYRSLCQLSSVLQSNMERTPKNEVNWSLLDQHSAGLICLSGGREGWIERYIRAEYPATAVRIASRLGGIFANQAFLSFSPHRQHDQVAMQSLRIGERFGLQPVAVQPVYCLSAAEHEQLRLLHTIARNGRIADTIVPQTSQAIWRSPQEMLEIYSDYPEMLTRGAEIVEECEDVLPDGRAIWPNLKLSDAQSPDEALAIAATTGLEIHFDNPSDLKLTKRLERELNSIKQHGFAPLFLIVADIANYARQTEIPMNTRGSVANSLVAYCIGITNVDPIAHELLFERFLNPARANLPDIDLDFCSRRRDEVLAYVRRTYGEERVALVATVSTMQPKSAVRETAKAYGLPEARTKKLSALWPHHWHPDPRRRDKQDIGEVIKELEDPFERAIMLAAAALIGAPHHLSVHPGGVVITPGPLTAVVPVQMAPKGFLITQYDYKDLETIGLPKIDLLGIRALTVLADTAVAIQAADPDFHLSTIPLNDPQTRDLLTRGDTIGVFQCESSGAQRTLRQLKAKSVHDLAVANAFFKPGPATGGMAKAFVRRYRGEEVVTYLHPTLEPILSSTQGVLLFQEQVLRIATEIAGLSWAQADNLRHGMSKFQSAQMAALARQFQFGCCRPAPKGPGLSREQARTLWEQVMAFAGYGFNQGHATAYADVSYRSAFLKTHYPAEFLCARLADHGGFHHPAIYMAEARRLEIKVMPPHVNKSGSKFTLTKEDDDKGLAAPTLWMGLGQVRDLRRKSVTAISAGRADGAYTSLRDLVQRVALQPKEVLHLIQCGALDGLAASRTALLAEAEPLARAGSVRQLAFDFAVQTAAPPESSAQCLNWEKHLLGLPVSVHPLDLVVVPETAVALADLPTMRDKLVTVCGTRLPGWTGSKGFFLGDRTHFVIVKTGRGLGIDNKRVPWQPLQLNGRWRIDEWGDGWFQAESAAIMVG
ncbi:MAG: DNA polymerase III subunit alpha [Anaerolineales bacterium]|nr:DNA polymerase III subunit alpha [Anaerolineales bacterium]